MIRLVILAGFVASLAGCYNPRYPDKGTDAETPYRSTDAQDQAARDRRDRAAGSGATYAR
ncbi:MAG TPA: hypothetical protein VNU64_04465 [Burkholderiales bacterium]|nr:hypothetical protein [Burkholderiales bacterium]